MGDSRYERGHVATVAVMKRAVLKCQCGKTLTAKDGCSIPVGKPCRYGKEPEAEEDFDFDSPEEEEDFDFG